LRSVGETVPLSLFNSGAIASELDLARRTRRAIAPPAELAHMSLREAYDVQDAVVARRELAGAARSGWKLGLTSRVKQRLMGVGHPLFGRIFADGSVPSSSSVVYPAFIRPRAEPELAFGLAAPLEPDADVMALMRAVAWIAPALEITDSRYLPGRRTAVELVADNTSSAAYVIGGRVRLDAAPRLDAIGTQIIRSGSVLASGTTADVLGDPFAALRLLAEHLAERGLHTEAGDVILSGAITDAFPAAPGDRFEARLRGLGTAAVVFA
jgi:2-oxo-3-hexenedioate decarboxylase